MRLVAEVVELRPETVVPLVATHPEDNYVLATALEGNADDLVTGDKQLQKLAVIGVVRIVIPAELLETIRLGG